MEIEPQKDPDTHSPAYLHSKATRLEKMKKNIMDLIEVYAQAYKEEHDSPHSVDSGRSSGATKIPG